MTPRIFACQRQVYFILDELVLGGEISETARKSILDNLARVDKMDWPRGEDKPFHKEPAEVITREGGGGQAGMASNFGGLVLGCIQADFCKWTIIKLMFAQFFEIYKFYTLSLNIT